VPSPKVQLYVYGSVPFPDTDAENVIPSPVTGFVCETVKSIVRADGVGMLCPAIAEEGQIVAPMARWRTTATVTNASRTPRERASIRLLRNYTVVRSVINLLADISGTATLAFKIENEVRKPLGDRCSSSREVSLVRVVSGVGSIHRGRTT